jgi:hypothetical protein
VKSYDVELSREIADLSYQYELGGKREIIKQTPPEEKWAKAEGILKEFYPDEYPFYVEKKVKGKKREQIANEMCVSVGTVDNKLKVIANGFSYLFGVDD